jgi:hypothetical protein
VVTPGVECVIVPALVIWEIGYRERSTRHASLGLNAYSDLLYTKTMLERDVKDASCDPAGLLYVPFQLCWLSVSGI